MSKGMTMLYDIVDDFDAVGHRGHRVRLSLFKEIVKDLIRENGYSNEMLNKLTVILGGVSMPVVLLDDNDAPIVTMPGIYDASETLEFNEVVLTVNQKREEHLQGTGKPIKDVIGLPNVSNKGKWELFFKLIKEELDNTQPSSESVNDDDEIED